MTDRDIYNLSLRQQRLALVSSTLKHCGNIETGNHYGKQAHRSEY